MNYLAKKYPKLIISFFISVESNLDKKTKQNIVKNIIKNPQEFAFFVQLLQSLLPMSSRAKGIDNDLSQYKNIEGLDISKIKTPTLVLYGKHDIDVKPFYAYYMQEKMPDVKLYELKDGFHFFWFSKQFEEMEKEKIKFIKEHLDL